MLSEITWNNYLTAVGLTAAAYYIIVGAIYYKKEINDFLKVKIHKGKSGVSKEEANGREGNGDKSSFEELEQLVGTLRGILQEAGKEAEKPELLIKINARLANYGGLRHPAFRNAIKNFIIINAKTYCDTEFTDDELEQSWLNLP